MSGIAEILITLGFRVSGSDAKESDVTARLRGLGAEVFLGHKAAHLPASASLVVFSSAVAPSNPEIMEANARGLPIVRRAEVLAELMRLKFGVGVAGSHGKTTTTSMCGAVLEAADLDPTVVIGGQIKALGTGGRLGRGEYLVAEADESDRSFLLLKPTVAVVTNIDNEHMNAYRSQQDLHGSFEEFVGAVPFYGLAVLCIDDPVVLAIAQRCKRRVVRYGFSAGADITATDVVGTDKGMAFNVIRKGESLGRFVLPMLGRHLVLNSLAAIAVGLEFGVPVESIRGALSSFGGVKRRLEVIGTERGVTVMNDYGHHPTEIRATLTAIKECLGSTMSRFTVVFQPHRYSRTKLCWEDFCSSFGSCDRLLVTDIYSAGEEPIVGVSSSMLCDAISHKSKLAVATIDEVPALLVRDIQDGEVVLCLGAGSIGNLPEQVLAALRDPAVVTKTVLRQPSPHGVLEPLLSQEVAARPVTH